jgi:KipI family sensor histidine kinase inhibitor
MRGGIRLVGDAALLIDVEPQLRLAAVEALAVTRSHGVVDVVGGERTVLLTLDPQATDLARLDELVASCLESLRPLERADPDELTIPVRYDGVDLDEVADLTGLDVREVVRRHLAGNYVVAYLGFAPGFGYLDGLDPALHVPRLASPRTRVEAGAVAIAGGRACVYPRASPGGWRVLGHTDVVLFDPAADPPTPLRAGRRIRFVAE